MISFPESLTDRQKACLRLVAQGHKNLSVAMALGIAESTAKEHIEKATKALGARNRRHAAAMLLDYEKEGPMVGSPLFWPVGDHGLAAASERSTEATLRDGEGLPPTLSPLPPLVIERGKHDTDRHDLYSALTIVAMAAGLVFILSTYPTLVTLAEHLAAFLAKSFHR